MERRMALAVAGESSNHTTAVFGIDLVDSHKRTRRLRAYGLLNERGAQMLDAVLTAHQQTGARYIRLDLAAVTGVDPAGLTTLLQAHQRFLADGGRLVLTGVGGPALAALAAAGLDHNLLIVNPAAPCAHDQTDHNP